MFRRRAGLFELKYFFTRLYRIAQRRRRALGGSGAVRIKQMIEHESENDILSDDAIVEQLKK